MTDVIVPTSLPGDLIRGMRALRSDLVVRIMTRNPGVLLDEIDPVIDRLFEDVARTPEWWRGEEPDDGEDED